MDLVESFFHLDSLNAVDSIQRRAQFKSEVDSVSILLSHLDALLMSFMLPTIERRDLLRSMSRPYDIRQEARALFTKAGPTLRQMIDSRDKTIGNSPWINRKAHIGRLLTLSGFEGLPQSALNDLLPSFLHMSVNRVLGVLPKAKEALMYDMLSRAYDYELATLRSDP